MTATSVSREPREQTLRHAVVLFDGVCNLCTSSVQFIIRRDPRGELHFASLQSEAGASFARSHGIEAGDLFSVMLVEDGEVFERSEAALRIARKLSGAWPLLRIFRLVPRVVRDALYDLVARNRYRWFGRQDACMVPTPELRGRFLDHDSPAP